MLAERIDDILDAGGIPDPKALARESPSPSPASSTSRLPCAKVLWTATTASSVPATATAPPAAWKETLDEPGTGTGAEVA